MDTLGINEKLMRIKQNANSDLLLQMKGDQNVQRAGMRCSRCWFCDFRERDYAFSLDFRPFGPSVLDGARSKIDLRGEGYAWTPIWWSSDNSKR